jgi:hypothetical protein
MNFKEWAKIAVSEHSCDIGRDGIRDVYVTPKGIRVYHEVIMPRSIFKPQYEHTMIDIIYPVDKEGWLKEQGVARLDTDRYTEEGFGYPIFSGDGSLERAYNFIDGLKDAVKVHKENAHQTIFAKKEIT